MSTPEHKVEGFLRNAPKWQQEMKQLRGIVLDCGLTEEFKWGKPCYSFQNSNVVIIQPFKDSCALMFFQGGLLKDPGGVLERPGENSRIARRIRFSSAQDIAELEPVLKSFLQEAIEAVKAGLKVEADQEEGLEFPEEFQRALADNPALKAAFASLTPGRQREYNLHFSGAKQSKTRQSRVEKCVPQILAGKGLRD